MRSHKAVTAVTMAGCKLNKNKNNRKDSLFDLGGEINGEITFLNYKFEAPKMYLTM